MSDTSVTATRQRERASARPRPGPEGAYPRRWKALIVLCVTNFMIILDAQIVILALPSIQKQLGMSTGGAQWVLSAYLLAFGGLLLFGGRLADLLGRRRLFLSGAALFMVSSLLCGIAWTGGALIVARVLQGISAAMLAPAALAILMTMFPGDSERTKALAYWSGVGGLGATAALLVGGGLTGTLGWEWIFFLNLPVAAVMLAFGRALLPTARDSHPAKTYDAAGAGTITFALVALIAAIVEAPAHGWTSEPVLGLLATAAVIAAVFVIIESRSAAPLMPLRVFRSRLFVAGNVTIALITMIAWGASFTVSGYAQDVLGYSPLQFGLATTVMTLMAVLGAYTAQATITKIGLRAVAAAGMVLMGTGAFLLSHASAHGSYLGSLFPGLLLLGIGVGGGPVAAISAALSGVNGPEAGAASGINTAAFQTGAALGTAIVTSVIVSRTGASSQPAVLTDGFQAAFTACVVFAAIGLCVAVSLLKPLGSRRAPGEQPTD